jgi:hypothetical protein
MFPRHWHLLLVYSPPILLSCLLFWCCLHLFSYCFLLLTSRGHSFISSLLPHPEGGNVHEVVAATESKAADTTATREAEGGDEDCSSEASRTVTSLPSVTSHGNGEAKVKRKWSEDEGDSESSGKRSWNLWHLRGRLLHPHLMSMIRSAWSKPLGRKFFFIIILLTCFDSSSFALIYSGPV